MPINSATSSSYTPLVNDSGQYLRASATYSDGQGPFKNAQIIAKGPVLNYAGPLFVGAESGSTTVTVDENAIAGSAVGAPVTAESGTEGVTYGLSGSDASLFTVDEMTGQIRVADGANLDYESASTTYTVTLVAIDDAGDQASVEVVISMLDVSLPGVAARYDRNHDEQINRDEALIAIADYYSGAIAKQDVLGVTDLYESA